MLPIWTRLKFCHLVKGKMKHFMNMEYTGTSTLDVSPDFTDVTVT